MFLSVFAVSFIGDSSGVSFTSAVIGIDSPVEVGVDSGTEVEANGDQVASSGTVMPAFGS